MIDNNSLWQVIKSYFNSLPNKEDEEFTKQQINDSISFRGSTLWILIFAIFIASLGLNVNSTAVIIGAMIAASSAIEVILVKKSNWICLKQPTLNWNVHTD